MPPVTSTLFVEIQCLFPLVEISCKFVSLSRLACSFTLYFDTTTSLSLLLRLQLVSIAVRDSTVVSLNDRTNRNEGGVVCFDESTHERRSERERERK